jgi:MarR family transcriptional regulator for hemolysin
MTEAATIPEIPVGTRTLILSKLYYGVLSKSLENVDTERYFSVLHYIQNNDGCCCQQNICNSLAIDKTAMVKILDALTKAGLIERKTNPSDRREHYIHLSAKGKKQTKEISKAFKRIDEQMFAGLPDKEVKAFMHVLEKASLNLKELPSNDLFFNYKKTKK